MSQTKEQSGQAQLFPPQDSAARAEKAREMLKVMQKEMVMSIKTRDESKREAQMAYHKNLPYTQGGPDDPNLKSAALRLQALESARKINRNLPNAVYSTLNKSIVARPKAPATKKIEDPYVAPERAINEFGTVRGVVARIRFSNPVDDFYICDVLPVGATASKNRVVIKGNGPSIQYGMEVEAKGVWAERNGETQLQNAIINESFPMTVEGIRALMNSGFVKGIGPETTENLLAKFGTKLFDVVEFEPDRLKDVQGMGDKRRDAFVQSIHEKKASVRIFAFLAEGGLTPAASMKVFKEFENNTIEAVKANPYIITRIDGIGFRTADDMAMKYGLSSTSATRIVAAMEEVVRVATDNGSTAVPKTILNQEIIKLIGNTATAENGETFAIDVGFVSPIVESTLLNSTYLSQRALLVPDNKGGFPEMDCVSLQKLCRAEIYIAGRITRMAQDVVSHRMRHVDMSAPRFGKLDESQREAARTSLSAPISIITGRPGCGKTTVTKSIIEDFESKGMKVLLMAPTGKAAKRMKEATGRQAFTIHSALGYDGENYNKNASDPIEHDVVIVDEASMVDTQLMANLLRAIAPGTQLIMIGDIEQLPSIGAGRVLRDIIETGVIPVSTLMKIHRQAASSAIIANAHRIINGEMPIAPEPGQDNDFKLVPCYSNKEKYPHREDQEAALLQCFRDLLDEGYAASDIQVLSPMKKYGMGVNSLNVAIKNMLNPASNRPKEDTLEKLSSEGVKIQVSIGDRVMQTVNNKEIGVNNGELGYVKAFDHVTKKMTIHFGDEGDKEIPMSGLASLDLAYAKTIHKSQGSEYPAVILPMVNGHWNMLNRNLVYTGLTRGKERAVMIGDLNSALKKAVTTDGVDHRITGLQDEILCRMPKAARNHEAMPA